MPKKTTFFHLNVFQFIIKYYSLYIYICNQYLTNYHSQVKTSRNGFSCCRRGAQLQVVRREIVAKERQLAMLPGGRQEACLGFWWAFGDVFFGCWVVEPSQIGRDDCQYPNILEVSWKTPQLLKLLFDLAILLQQRDRKMGSFDALARRASKASGSRVGCSHHSGGWSPMEVWKLETVAE